MVTEDLYSKWSTLPPDLVRRIADSFLHTNDVDCYMDMRAVCPSWRAATDDPRSDALDPRFRPRRWIMLDEVFPSEGEEMLLLNTDTGRFLRKNLPQLGDYHAVAATQTGYLVLAEKSPPHAASLLNPLTGVVVRFVAPVPPEVGSADIVFLDSSSFNLTLYCDSPHKVYFAGRDSNSFFIHEPKQATSYDILRKTFLLGGVYSDMFEESTFNGVFDDLRGLLHGVGMFFPGGLLDGNDLKWFPLVGSASHMLLVVNTTGSTFVFKKDIKIGKVVALDNINNYAIIIGHQRCLAVDVDKFAGIEANCVYYTEILGLSAHICKCNIKDRKVERISEAAEFVKQGKQFVLVVERPLTIIHLLCSYTINIPESQLALQHIP